MSQFILKKIARVVEGTDQNFHHVFGGKSKHKGVTPKGCKLPLHLVYTFDTADPSFPLQIPGIRYLPLYYSFPYNAGACGYRMKSEDEIEVLYMQTMTVHRNFPYPDYPEEFAERRVQLVPIPYELHKSLAYYCAVEDADELNDADRRLIFEESGYPFTQLGGIQRMWQGVPPVCCPNPSCDYSKYPDSLNVFAVVWNEPHAGVYLWEEDASSDECDVQLIFQICPSCYSIHACNRCT